MEQSLVAHVFRGEPLDLIPDVPEGVTIDEDTMRSWGPSKTCSATAIRDILRGQLAADPDPRGLQLRGAKITGRLDLENLSTKVNFELSDCLLEEGIIAREARMGSVRLRGCRIKHRAKPPLDAAGLRCNLLDLSRATIIGHDEAEDGGAVLLRGARIDGHLDCTGASLSNDKGPALTADGLEVRLGMFLRGGFTATGARKRGAVLLRGVRIGRHLVCSGASLCNDTGPALVAIGLRVTQDVYLDEEFTAAGTVNLTSARISGHLSCRGAHLNGRDENGNALHGERMKVGGDVLLDNQFTTADGAVCLLGADISGQLSCGGAQLNGRDKHGNALHGEGLKVGGDVLLEEKFTTADGAVSLLGADISGQLSCRGAQLNGRDKKRNALHGERMKVGGDVLLQENFTTAAGAVCLLGADISGQLSCRGAQLNGRDKERNALHGERMKVGGDVLLQEKFTTAAGAVCLLGADISGQLSCRGAQLKGHDKHGNALHGDGIRVGRDVFLNAVLDKKALPQENFTTAAGAVSLLGADISGQLSCRGAQLKGHDKHGNALHGERMKVGGDVLLQEQFAANSAINLVGAQIGGNLDCTGAQLSNATGPALDAFSLQVGQDVDFTGGFTAAGSSDHGAINLNGAHIGGSLLCDGARLCNRSGPALTAYGLHVAGGRGVFFRDGFTATGAGERGVIRLNGARISSDLDFREAELSNKSGPALITDGLHVGQGMYLSGGFTATGGGDDVAVDLRGAQVGGTLVFAPAHLEHKGHPCRRLAVDRLTYAGVPQISDPKWLDLLRNWTPDYAAQPYQQLAAGYRALGDERQVREILMAQRDDQLARTQPRPRWTERLWGRITKVTLGYGYKPWRALWFLAGVLAVSCVLAVVLGAHGALVQTSKKALPHQPCTVIQQVSVGLDLNLPVGASVARAQCGLTTDTGSVTAFWLTVAGWVLRVLAWVFAVLFIAGFGSPYLTGVPPIRPLRPAHPDPTCRTYGALAAVPLRATVRDPLRRGSLLPYRAGQGFVKVAGGVQPGESPVRSRNCRAWRGSWAQRRVSAV